MKSQIQLFSFFVMAIFIISCGKTTTTKPFVCGDTITDIDGNTYNTVSIGSQCWMKENLKTSKYNDGTAITTGLDITAWNTTTSGAFSIYNDADSNNTKYGKLYNGYAVQTGKLAPSGWHVSTDAEFKTLINYLVDSIAGAKMKSSSGWIPVTGIVNNNSSGFSALPAGVRYYNSAYPGGYSQMGITTTFRTSTDSSGATFVYDLENRNSYTYRYRWDYNGGLSVRCVKD